MAEGGRAAPNCKNIKHGGPLAAVQSSHARDDDATRGGLENFPRKRVKIKPKTALTHCKNMTVLWKLG